MVFFFWVYLFYSFLPCAKVLPSFSVVVAVVAVLSGCFDLGKDDTAAFCCSIDSAIGESKLSALVSNIGEYGKQFSEPRFLVALVVLDGAVVVVVVVFDAVVVDAVELVNNDEEGKVVGFVGEHLVNVECWVRWSRGSGVVSREDANEVDEDEIDSRQLSRSEFVRLSVEVRKLSRCKLK